VSESGAPEGVGLTPGAAQLIESALVEQRKRGHAILGVNHWLLVLVDRHGPMAEGMAKGFTAAALRPYLREQLDRAVLGDPLDPETVERSARQCAAARGRAAPAERDIAAAILLAAKYELPEGALRPTGSTPTGPSASKRVEEAPRAKRPTPTLDKLGRDLTREAREGRLGPRTGREAETDLMIETLCRHTKRNPVLVGPAGVGKTAIVEGLAQRIVGGQVPEPLRNVRVIAIQPSTLIAGAGHIGEFAQRMETILSEASQDGVVIFIDEVHSIMGLGGPVGTSDVSSMLKPALARGDLACIAATTDEEYRRFIESDAALERRFQPVRVQELGPQETLQVLVALSEGLARQRGVTIGEPVLRRLIELATRYLRNRHFPDKAVDLLEQCIAAAVSRGQRSVELADAQAVVERSVGFPVAVNPSADALNERLAEFVRLPQDHLVALANRLAVTLRGLDVRPNRPNAVVLLVDEAADHSEPISRGLAQALFGDPQRVITIPFERFQSPHDVTELLGAPPGYVGYSDHLAIHDLAQIPWCVVLCQRVDLCRPQFRAVLSRGLAEGHWTDGRGKRVYMSDAVVVLTAHSTRSEPRSAGTLGFGRGTSDIDEHRPLVIDTFEPELLALCNVVCDRMGAETAHERQLTVRLLDELARRYRAHRLEITWDKSFVEWVDRRRAAQQSEAEWECWVDEELSPLLLRHLPASESASARSLTLLWDGSVRVVLDPIGQGGP
jgi:ATP-dependent Clp protease ATP-binding subunit ClpC